MVIAWTRIYLLLYLSLPHFPGAFMIIHKQLFQKGILDWLVMMKLSEDGGWDGNRERKEVKWT